MILEDEGLAVYNFDENDIISDDMKHISVRNNGQKTFNKKKKSGDSSVTSGRFGRSHLEYSSTRQRRQLVY